MSLPAPTPPASLIRSSRLSRFPYGATALAMAVLITTVAIWWRNHDILRDLYDASSIIVAVGKLEAGLKPYADFRSTMQSATYVLNAFAENVFGANYLGLVKGGLILNLFGACALAWLWRRTFDAGSAWLLAGAVTLAGLAQHVFVFYNPVGLLCLSIVWAGLAAEPRLWRFRSVSWFVVAALIIGGANKINFHALTLAVAVLIVLRSAVTGMQTARQAAAAIGILGVAGLVLPLLLELAWTGASLKTWTFNVLRLPSERVGFALEGISTDLLWLPPFNVHHSVPFKPFNAVGLALVVAAAIVAWRHGVTSLATSRQRGLASLLLLACTGIVGLGGLLLTTTNVEVITLTSLAFPVGAAAIVATHRRPGSKPGHEAAAQLVPIVSILWILVGAYSAWQGSRVIFGDTPPKRETYQRLANPSRSVAYLKGVRLEPGWHDSLLATVKEIERIERTDPTLSTVLFGPAFEWMERAYPGSIVREMPVWYHHGTSLSSEDGPWLAARLREKGVERLLLNPHWESWPGSFWLHLASDYRRVDLGRFTRIYERKGPSEIGKTVPTGTPLHAWSFRERTGSNVHWNATQTSSDTALFESPWGGFAGRFGGADWTWAKGPFLAQGNFILLHYGEAPVEATCRIVGANDGMVLFEEKQMLSAERTEIRVPFQVSAGGNPIRLSIEVPAEASERVLGGWRDVRIGHAGNADVAPPAMLAKVDTPATPPPAPSDLIRLPIGEMQSDNGWHSAPFEFWRPVASGRHEARVAINLQRRPDNAGHPTLVTLAWYKAGRVEFLRQTIVHPKDPEVLELSSGLPEEGGWVGVLALAADPTALPGIRIRAPEWHW